MSMRAGRFSTALLLIVSAFAGGQGAKDQSRTAFAQAMAKVKRGMAKDEVRALLGTPDQDLDEADSINFGDDGAYEIWSYGSDSKFGLATLGAVCFGQDGTCNGPEYPYSPNAIPDGTVDESQLRSLLSLMFKGESTDFYNSNFVSDPLYVVRITNALQPLGKEKVLAVVREYARIHPLGSDNLTIYNAVRALFIFPANTALPNLVNFGPKGFAGDPKFYRDDPFVIVGDIPIVLQRTSPSIDSSKALLALADVCDKYGTLRSQPLQPTNDLSGIPSVIKSMTAWQPVLDDAAKNGWSTEGIILAQLAMMARTAAVPARGLGGMAWTSNDDSDARWQDVLQQFASNGSHWDANVQAYVPSNGQTLPDPQWVYKKSQWVVPNFEDFGMHIVMLRSGYDVIASVRWKPKDNALPNAVIRVLGGDSGSQPIAELHLPAGKVVYVSSRQPGSSTNIEPSNPTPGTFFEWIIDYADAHKISFEIEQGEHVSRSPVFDFTG